MKILQISYFYEFNFGGAEISTKAIEDIFKEDLHYSVDTLCIANPSLVGDKQKYRIVLPKFLFNNTQLFKRVLMFLNNPFFDYFIFKSFTRQYPVVDDYDIVICYDINAIGLANLFKRTYQLPMMHVMHENMPKHWHVSKPSLMNKIINKYNLYRSIFYTKVINNFEYIVANSKFILREYQSFSLLHTKQSPEHITSIYYPDKKYLDLLEFSTFKRYDELSINLLFIGRIAPEKGLDLLVNAFMMVNDGRLRLNIVGQEGPLTSFVVDACQKDTRINLIGKVDYEKVLAIQQASDIICCPSTVEEPFGKTIFEARCLSKYIISSNRGGIPEIINDYPMATIIDTNRVNHLIEIDLKKAIEDIVLRIENNETPKYNKPEFLERFATEKTINDFANVIRNVTR
jgi:glycosyltransferase involved in cell wall biosynthesis